MGASLAADFPVEMASQPLRGVRSTKLAVQGLLCIVWYGRLVHGNPLPLGMGSGQKDGVTEVDEEQTIQNALTEALQGCGCYRFIVAPPDLVKDGIQEVEE